MTPRYPNVRISLHTSSPLALVSAVRLGLRRSRVDRSEIRRFTEEAMNEQDPARMRDVCASWASVERIS